MTENNRLTEITERLKTNAYFTNPLSDVNVTADMRYLLTLVDEQHKKIDQLEKKNEVLSNHAMELTQEIENVKSDFGNNR